MIGPIRNHPISLLKSVIIILVFVIIALLSAPIENSSEGLTVGIVVICMAAVILFIIVRVWHKTTYTFTDTEILVNKDTVFKNKKTIPYSKIASTNVVRTVMDRIAGTSTLSFNINSGVNAAIPEATLVAKRGLANQIYDMVHIAMAGTAISEHVEQFQERPASVVSYNPFEIVLHSLFSSSTLSLIYSSVFFVYSVYGFFVDPTAMGGALITAIFFIGSLIVPVVTKIIRYFDFSVYRVGRTIYLDHGLFRKYHSEFDISRINSVKIQKPFFPRIMGRCYLQAEVIGINAVQGDVTPTVCLMSSEKVIRAVMMDLLPEFIYEGETMKQPKEAKVPICIGSVAAIVMTFLISAGILLMINGFFDPDLKINEGLLVLTNVIVLICTVMLMILYVFRGYVSLRTKDYTIGKDMFTFTNGVVDRTIATIQYDRVQAVYMRSGPIARRYSLAKCRVSLLSAAGGSRTGSGYFRIDDLDKISDIMLRRIADGSYDSVKII